MFDSTDTKSQFDPFESAYREAYADKLSDNNPIQDILKQEGILVDSLSEKKADSNTLLAKLTNLPNLFTKHIQRYAEENWNMSPKMVRLIVAITNVVLLPCVMLYSMLTFGGAFRKGLMRKEEKRYGKMKDLSATEKDDDDLENEDGDEEDDDDEDDDEDE